MFVPQRSDYQSFYSFRNRTHRTLQLYSVTGAFLLKEDFSGCDRYRLPSSGRMKIMEKTRCVSFKMGDNKRVGFSVALCSLNMGVCVDTETSAVPWTSAT